MMEPHKEANVSLHEDVKDLAEQVALRCNLHGNSDEQPKGEHSETQRHTFVKKGGTDNMSGPLYEIKMAALLYLRGLRCTKWFLLAVNMDEAGAFDDTVFQFQSMDPGDPETKTCFIQLKHKNPNALKIPLKEFKTAKSRFYLKKYYNSYTEVEGKFSPGSCNPIFRGNFEESIFILFTNGEIETNKIKCGNLSTVDNILNTCSGECVSVLSFTADDNILCDSLKEDSQIHTFLDKLKVFVNQANEKQLNDLIKQEIVSYFHFLVPEIDTVTNDFILKVQKWCQNDDFFLTKSWPAWAEVKTSLKTRLTKLNHWRDLGYTFKENECDSLVQHIRSNVATLFLTMVGSNVDLRLLKLSMALERTHRQRYLLVNASELVEHLNEILSVWDSELCDVLAIDTEDSIDKMLPVLSRLQVILAKTNKILVLILDANNSTLVHILSSILVDCCEEYRDIWNLCQFDEVSQEYILSKKVSFQGYEVALCLLVDTCPKLKQCINSKVLAKLLGMDKFIIGTKLEENSEGEEFYIARTVDFEVEVNDSVLQDEELLDIFSVSGISYKELKNLVPKNEDVDMWDTKYMGHSSRYITLESEYDSDESSFTDDYDESNTELDSETLSEDDTVSQLPVTESLAHVNSKDVSEEPSFDLDDLRGRFLQICNATKNQTVHWLEYKGNHWFWKESQGDTTSLQNHIVKESDIRNHIFEYMNEYKMCSLEAEYLTTSWGKLTCIGGEPGMGKSVLFSHIACKMKQNDCCMWVVKISLSSLTEILSKIDSENLTLEKVTDMLINSIICNESSCPDFDELFFRESLINTGKVAILLDAFDEISPTYSSKVVSCIRVLLETKLSKLWVSFRPIMQNELQNTFTTPSFTLQPFTYENQQEFLMNVWQNKLGGSSTDTEHLKSFVQNLLELVYDLDFDSPITGIPLHIMMLAQAYEQQMKDFIKSHDVSLIPKYLKLHQLYKGFIDKRRDIYCIKKNEMNLTKPAVIHDAHELHKLFMKQHTKCALVAVLSPEELAILHDTTIQEDVESFLTTIESCSETTGIIDDVNNHKPHFIHFTFAEYLVAQWLAQNFEKNKTFIENYSFKDTFELSREMFDYILADKYEFHQAIIENDFERIQLLEQIQEVDSGGRTPLHLAALYGNKNTVSLLLDRGGDIDCKDTMLMWTPICYAEKVKNWGVVDTLLQKGAKCHELGLMKSDSSLYMFLQNDTKSVVKKGCTTLIRHALYNYSNSHNTPIRNIESEFGVLKYGVYYGQLDILKYLIQEGTDVHDFIEGATCLHISAGRGHVHLVKFLVDEEGFEVDIKDIYNSSPLHFGAREGHMEVVCYLVEKGANICEYNYSHITSIHQAALGGHIKILTYLLEKVKNIDDSSNVTKNLVCFAAQSESLEVVKYLLKNGYDIDFNNNIYRTPLYNAMMWNQSHIVRYLINQGADVTIDAILHLATDQKKYYIVHFLVERGADVNIREKITNQTILHKIAMEGNADEALYMVENGANINALNQSGDLPLHISLSNGHIELSKMLIDKGSDVNLPNLYSVTPLCEAIKNRNNLTIVKSLVEKGADINTMSKDIGAPLHIAAKQGCEEIVRYLVENGADVHSMCTHTPLHSAARSGKLWIVQYLLEQGADINALNSDGGTPLLCAACTDNVNIVHHLLENGANINATDDYGCTPLHSSTSFLKLRVVQYLVEKEVNINATDRDGQTPLHKAVSSSYLMINYHMEGPNIQYHVVQYLILKGANINAIDNYGHTPLHSYVLRNVYGEDPLIQYQIVQHLIEKGANINVTDNNGHTPLHTVVSSGQYQIVQHFIEKGANMNAMDNIGHTPLHTAASSGQYQIVQHLIEKGANINVTDNEGHTPLHTAASSGQYQIVQHLIDKGANINVADNNGHTPLHTAASSGQYQIVQHLIEIGANINVTDDNGHTPLHTAASSGQYQIVQHLIEKGVNINVTDNNGHTPLHTAASSGQYQIVEHFIEKGANMNAMDNIGHTPLHTAASSGQYQIVQHLIEKGANINVADNNGHTPLHTAASSGQYQIVQHLIEKGANINATDNNGHTPLHTAASSS